MEEIILNAKEFGLFRALIYKLTGISLSDSKRQLVQSRLSKRLRAHAMTDYRAYYDMVIALDEGHEEITSLINAVTTNKTAFFREAHHFDYVQRQFVPEMVHRVKSSAAAPRIRVWHAGCSTGEECYTLAMVLRESLRGQGDWDIRQLASDIDTSVLAHAERGVYDRERVEPVPDTMLRRWFLKGRGEQSEMVRARPELGEQITFRRINLLDPTWPIRSDIRFDMIFCRNVVIYFDKPTQQALFARFAERLRPGGYLFIGHSESLIGISEAFREHRQNDLSPARSGGASRRADLGGRRTGASSGETDGKAGRMTARRPDDDSVSHHYAIHIGGVFASREPAVVRTVLGSCIAVCLRDPVTCIGGMNHFMLPSGGAGEEASARYGIHAMELLINDCMKLGADRRRFEAKLFGGGHVLRVRESDGNVPQRNIAFALEFLQAERIPILKRDLGGYAAREIYFYTHSGRLLLKRLAQTGHPGQNSAMAALERDEREQMRRITAPPARADDSNITLF